MLFWIHGLYMQAQRPEYPRGYFRNPLSIPMELSANFGELRPNHWHMGFDIRTNAQENLPVSASAGGYIAKVGIRPQSFGRFIIINHPNGLSTLYGHLNNFYPELEEYVTAQQYKQESWAVELDFTPGQFPVNKGQFIAYSGNTGGSKGPHLHFEIIDTKTTKRLNPALFDLPLTDKVSPTLVKLVMYDRSKSVYEQTPRFFALKNTDSGYIIPKLPVIKTGLNKLSFALQMYDKSSSGGSPNGVYAATLYMDEEPQIAFVLDSIDYDETVFINAQIDYKYDYNGGPYLQHLAQLPGDNGVAYKKIKNDGLIFLDDTLVHSLRIEVKDAYTNTSSLYFSVQYNDSLAALIPQRTVTFKLSPQQENKIQKDDFEMLLPAGSLYDSVPAYYYRDNAAAYNSVSAKHQVNDPSYPVHDDFTVRIAPNKAVPEEWKKKLVIVKSGKGNTVKKANWEGQWLTARFGEFGAFQAFADLMPPSVNEIGSGDTINLSSSRRILFSPADNFGIKNFRAELDSQWIRFTNDKSRNWIYTFDDRCPYGIHHLKVTVEDIVGNITTKEWWFKRYAYTPPPPKKKTVKKTDAKKKKGNETKKKSVATKKAVSKKKK
jgi:murein DD-endopeptidase MepM/ murein hydrolase activator NlpD